MARALVLLSGGQDSVTCLFWAVKAYGREHVCAIGFDYGQRHVIELDYARTVCADAGIPYEIIALPAVNNLTENALTRKDIAVDAFAERDTPPNTLVEGRNLLFLTYAAVYAKARDIKILVTGVGEADYSGYPDCRDEFIKSARVTLSLAMDYPFVIETPLMRLDKAGIWALAYTLGVGDIVREHTVTCYNGTPGAGCGACHACTLRRRGYEQYIVSKAQNGAQI